MSGLVETAVLLLVGSAVGVVIGLGVAVYKVGSVIYDIASRR